MKARIEYPKVSAKKFIKDYYADIFPKYSEEEMVEECRKFQNGNKRLTKTLCNFFKEILWKSRCSIYPMSPMEFIHDDKMLGIAKYKVDKYPDFYGRDNFGLNVADFLRNAGVGAKCVSQFPIDKARDFYQLYAEPGMNIYDSSCGFGSRMSAALLSGYNYYGVDPNKELVIKLNECADFYKRNGLLKKNQQCFIGCLGSEVHCKKLDGKIDLAFTSPPYFNLEVYSDDKYANNRNLDDYENWLSEFMYPTLDNTVKYLKNGGYIIVNILNIKMKKNEYPLFNDCFDWLMSKKNLKHEPVSIKIDSKGTGNGHRFRDNKNIKENRDIMVFRKIGA